MAWVGVITNSGVEVLRQWVSGTVLNVDKAEAGTGTYAEATLMSRTSLVSKKADADIISAVRSEAGVKIKIQVTPGTSAYTLNQIGLYATVTGGTSTMIAIFQNEDGISIPSVSAAPDFEYSFYATVAVSNDNEFTFTVNTSALVTQSTLDEYIEEVTAHVTRIENIIGYDEYSNTETYVVGDYVTHGDEIYICISPVSSPGSFDNTKWELVGSINQFLNEVSVKADYTYESIYRPNLLENPFFTVNQRSVDAWTTGYGIDRWKGNFDVAQTITINSDHTLTVETRFANFEAGIEQPIAKVYGGKFSKETLTASVMLTNGKVYSFTFDYTSTTAWADSALFGGLKNGNEVLANWNIKVGSDSASDTRKYFKLYSNTNNASITVKAVKLEYGENSTLANDTEPDYQTELVKCQRYYQVLNVAVTTYGLTGGGSSYSTIVESIPYSVPMRTIPTVSITDRTFEVAISSISASSVYTDSFVLQIIPSATGFVRTRFIATLNADL